jgi:hypothetical protein
VRRDGRHVHARADAQALRFVELDALELRQGVDAHDGRGAARLPSFAPACRCPGEQPRAVAALFRSVSASFSVLGAKYSNRRIVRPLL